MSQKTRRLALICRPGHTWKFDKLIKMLPDFYKADVFINDETTYDDLDLLGSYDLVFYKSKDPRFLAIMDRLEARNVTIVLNTVSSVRLGRHRRNGAQAVAAYGVPIAEDFLGPLSDIPFERFVIKGEYEDDPMIPILVSSQEQHQALIEEHGPNQHVYAQIYLPSPWELKYYCAAGEIFAFRQRPALINPDKMATRHAVETDPILVDFTLKAMRAVGMDFIGVDFLFDEEGRPYLTDINAIQGLQNFQKGREAMIRYFNRRLNVEKTKDIAPSKKKNRRLSQVQRETNLGIAN